MDPTKITLSVLGQKLADLYTIHQDCDPYHEVEEGMVALVRAVVIVAPEMKAIFEPFLRAAYRLAEAREQGVRSTRMDHAEESLDSSFKTALAAFEKALA